MFHMRWLAYHNWDSGQHDEVCSRIGSSKKVPQLASLKARPVDYSSACLNKYPQNQFFNTTHIFHEHELIAICHTSENWPASIRGQQHRIHFRWMVSYSHFGQSLPFHERNSCVSMYPIVTLLHIHL